MKKNAIGLLIALLGLTTALEAQNINGNYQGQNRDNYPQNGNSYPQQDNRNPNNGNYNNDDLYARRQGNQYGNYQFNNGNPFDTRSQNYDPRNPFDPRPIYNQNGNGRYNDNDYRYNADPYDFCQNRQSWASRYFPLDPRNPYDVRNVYSNRGNGYGYNNRDYGNNRGYGNNRSYGNNRKYGGGYGNNSRGRDHEEHGRGGFERHHD
jgi:hypothetical protein